MNVVILVGGPSTGTRFRPLSFHCPKPLFPVAGAPLLSHHMRAVATLGSSLNKVFLLGFFPDGTFDDWIKSTSQDHSGLDVSYIKEDGRHGTAGALLQHREAITAGNPDSLFILSADIASWLPMTALLAEHKRAPETALVTVFGVPPPSSSFSLGSMITDKDTREIVHFVHFTDRPETLPSRHIHGGLCVVSMAFFDKLESMAASRPADATHGDPRSALSVTSTGATGTTTSMYGVDREVDPRRVLWLSEDVFPVLAGSKQLYLYSMDSAISSWTQVKSCDHALLSQSIYLTLAREGHVIIDRLHQPPGEPWLVGDVVVDPEATIDPSARVGPNVSVGKGAKIGAGARVSNSIILPGAVVQDRAVVLHSVVGWNANIGQWARVEGSLTVAEASKGVSSRSRTDGVTVLGEDVAISSETHVRNCVVLPHKKIAKNIWEDIVL